MKEKTAEEALDNVVKASGRNSLRALVDFSGHPKIETVIITAMKEYAEQEARKAFEAARERDEHYDTRKFKDFEEYLKGSGL